MYERGIRVLYRTLTREPVAGDELELVTWSATHHVDLPGWCAGEPRLAVALYLFGTRDGEDDVELVDWAPR